jgi:hypothetical protein
MTRALKKPEVGAVSVCNHSTVAVSEKKDDDKKAPLFCALISTFTVVNYEERKVPYSFFNNGQFPSLWGTKDFKLTSTLHCQYGTVPS